jgi:hypothetical protein
VPQPHGGALRRGITKNGGAGGRPPDEFKALCRHLASRQKTFAVVEKILDHPDLYPSLYTGALRWATENGYGKPKETVDVNIAKIKDLSDAELEALAKRVGL